VVASSTILDPFGKPLQLAPRRSTFDNAKTTRSNADHWSNTDNLGAVSQLTPDVRNKLAQRFLYEVQNNTYAAGAVRTLVGDTVGTSPRLQIHEEDDALNDAIEDLWKQWSAMIDLPQKLRLVAGVRYVAGESFLLFRESKKLDRIGFPVTLDLKPIEPAQVTDGYFGQMFRATGDDGILCDEDDEVVGYKILKRHPGDNRQYQFTMQPDVYDAANVVHWYIPDRPGQLRGYTPFTPAIGIFAQLRRFTQAVLKAADFGASIAGVLESDLPFDTSTPVTTDDYFDVHPVVAGQLITLPSGVTAKGFDNGKPMPAYDAFVNAKLREIGRCMNMPYGKIAGDHSAYNYSSGRLDDAAYWNDRAIERQDFQSRVLDRIFVKFLDFARFAIPALAIRQGSLWTVKHSWHYDARPSSDPVKDATGDDMNLTNGSDTLSAIVSRAGDNLDDVLRQRRRDLDLFKKYDLTPPEWSTGGAAPMRQQPQQGPQGSPQQGAFAGA